jgi:hypothetical protein
MSQSMRVTAMNASSNVCSLHAQKRGYLRLLPGRVQNSALSRIEAQGA